MTFGVSFEASVNLVSDSLSRLGSALWRSGSQVGGRDNAADTNYSLGTPIQAGSAHQMDSPRPDPATFARTLAVFF